MKHERVEFDHHVKARMHKDGRPMPLEFICLGLAGEAGEVLEAQDVLEFVASEFEEDARHALKLELGDVLWYAVAALHSLGTSLEAQMEMRGSEEPVRRDLAVSVGKFCDMVKKAAWHGKSYEAQQLIDAAFDITVQIAWVAWAHNIQLSDVMSANIDKLNKRYPLDKGGFVEGGGIR